MKKSALEWFGLKRFVSDLYGEVAYFTMSSMRHLRQKFRRSYNTDKAGREEFKSLYNGGNH